MTAAMTGTDADLEAQVGSYLTRVERLGDPTETLERLQREVRGWERHWAAREADLAQGGAEGARDVAREYREIRRLMSEFIQPRLAGVGALAPAEQRRMLNLMPPFDSEGGLRDFMLHFFQLSENPAGDLIYDAREAFERELFILHDLYKVKKTLEVVAVIRRALADPARAFASAFTPGQQRATLERLEAVLELMFEQTLPPAHRERVRADLSGAYLSARALLHRREEQALYVYPHVRDKYDYRRFFFLIYFKEGLKARLSGEERTYRFNFLHFQVLKREYLIDWLARRLEGDSRKFRVYSRYLVQGRSLLEWLAEAPEGEAELLMELPSPAFNSLVGQVNERLPEADRLAFEPEPEHFGFYHELKQQLHRAAGLARAPLQTLRRVVAEAEAAPTPSAAPAGPAPAPEPEAEPEPAPVPESEPEPAWEVVRLHKGQMGSPFLQDSLAGYNQRLAALRHRMGLGYAPFSAYVSGLLERTPESVLIQRRTPKHEWTLPYLVRHVSPAETRQYLVVLGAEVKARARGMGYQARERYQFTPYFILAAGQPEPDLGEPVGERHVRGEAFAEYDGRAPEVIRQVQRLIDVIREGTGGPR